jgi:hypothetical protein
MTQCKISYAEQVRDETHLSDAEDKRAAIGQYRAKMNNGEYAIIGVTDHNVAVTELQ